MLKNKSEIKLEFFNADLNLQLYDELKAIENWSKMIKDRLLLKKWKSKKPCEQHRAFYFIIL